MATRITGILETPVYVDDLAKAYDFYHGFLGLERMIEGDRIHAYDVAAGQVLIVCLRGASDEDALINGQKVPGTAPMDHRILLLKSNRIRSRTGPQRCRMQKWTSKAG